MAFPVQIVMTPVHNEARVHCDTGVNKHQPTSANQNQIDS